MRVALVIFHIACVFFLCGLSSCNRNSSATSKTASAANVAAESARRTQVPLRQIKASWKFYKAERNEEVWTSTAGGEEVKRLHRSDKGLLEWEEDYYYSGRTFSTIDGVNWENMVLHFDYLTGQFKLYYVGQSPAVETLMSQLPGSSTNQQTLSIADQILKLWGLSRL